jgi:hypothetical protein
MNDIYEPWSLPWHALHKNLAKGFGAQEAAGGSAARESVKVRSAVLYAGSWLSRARHREESPPPD